MNQLFMEKKGSKNIKLAKLNFCHKCAHSIYC